MKTTKTETTKPSLTIGQKVELAAGLHKADSITRGIPGLPKPLASPTDKVIPGPLGRIYGE